MSEMIKQNQEPLKENVMPWISEIYWTTAFIILKFQ